MSRFPVLYAGQRLTAPLLTSMMSDYIVKAANEDRTSTTTLTADTDLTTTLEANAVYEVEFEIHYATLSAAGFQTDWTTPTGATGGRSSVSSGSNQVSSSDVPGMWGVHAFNTAVSHGDRNSSTNQLFLLERAIVNTTNAGTLALRWAQDVSNAAATRVGVGSWLRVKRLS